MRLLATFVKVAVFIVLLGFAVRNTDPVTLRYYFDIEWRAPLVAILFAFFAAGAVLGVLSCLGIMLGQRWRLARLERASVAPGPVQAALPAEAAVETPPARRS
jgi:putative membrane protein